MWEDMRIRNLFQILLFDDFEDFWGSQGKLSFHGKYRRG